MNNVSAGLVVLKGINVVNVKASGLALTLTLLTTSQAASEIRLAPILVPASKALGIVNDCGTENRRLSILKKKKKREKITQITEFSVLWI